MAEGETTRGETTRRGFLRRAAGIGTAGLIPVIGWAAGAPDYLAAATGPGGAACLVGVAASGDACFRLPLPGRGHGAAIHPERREAVAFARHPGGFGLVVDTAEGREITRLDAPANRQLNGHGAFTADGGLLFTTETALSDGAGRLGIWDAMGGYRRVADIPSGGVAPHDIALTPDGERFAVANAGLPASSLVTLDAASGEVLDALALPDNLSVRHLAAGQDGTLVAALRWHGPGPDAPPPLLAVLRPGAGALAPMPAQPGLGTAAGGVAVSDDGRLAAITVPEAGLMLIIDLETGETEDVVAAAGVSGVAPSGFGFACSTRAGHFLTRGPAGFDGPEVRLPDLAFDSHLVRI